MDNLINKLVDDSNELQDQLVECREGIVSNTDEDSEEVAIKKLTEEEYSDTEEDMEQDAAEEPAEDNSEENEEEVEKEYFGKSGEEYYYLVGNESEEGVQTDLQIVDQEGKVVYSAKDNEVEITDIVDFIIQAIQEMDIEDISYDVFEKYILPKLVEPEEEEFDEEGTEEDELRDAEDDMIPEEDTFESISRVKYTHESKDYEVSLLPENKVKIGGKIFTLSDDTFNFYHISENKVDEIDLKDLAKDMLRAMDESELKELVEGYEERGKRDGTGPYKNSAQRKVTGDKGKRQLAGEKCPAKESKEKDSKMKTNEDIATDVKDLQKKAEAAVKDGDYIKAADYVSRLANVESSVGSVEDDTAIVEPVVDEVEVADETKEVEEEKVEEAVEEEVVEEAKEEEVVEEPVVEEAKEEELPDDVKEQVSFLDSLLADGMNR